MDIVSLYLPISVALLVGLVVSAAFGFPFRPSLFRRQYLVVLAPALFSLLTFLWGILMAHDDPYSLAPTWPVAVLWVLLILQCVASIIVVIFMKGYRWLSFFAVALQVWLGLFVTFVSGMSVTGDWV